MRRQILAWLLVLAALSSPALAQQQSRTVALTITIGRSVTLGWTASASPGVTGYNVYRGTAAGGESLTPLNYAPISGTGYLDANVVPGTRYYYVVTATDGSQQSPKSNEADAAVPTP
jgi:fibronectin type 3 domain-containing protein